MGGGGGGGGVGGGVCVWVEDMVGAVLFVGDALICRSILTQRTRT